MRPYFNRYTEDAIDLCDVLAAFSSENKASLHELCRVMGLPGKPDGISGADVEKYYREGRVGEIAAYCETDIVNTYRVWLRYELFRGRLSEGRTAPERSQSNRIHKDAQQYQAAPSERSVRRKPTGNTVSPSGRILHSKCAGDLNFRDAR